jgi:hypothetical protein
VIKSKSQVGTLCVEFFQHPDCFLIFIELNYLPSLWIEVLNFFLDTIKRSKASHNLYRLSVISIIYI